MNAGETAVRLVSPLADTLPVPVPVSAASDLAWQQQHQSSQPSGSNAEYELSESALKRDLEEMLHRNFASAAEYKATPEHWARILGALALWCAKRPSCTHICRAQPCAGMTECLFACAPKKRCLGIPSLNQWLKKP